MSVRHCFFTPVFSAFLLVSSFAFFLLFPPRIKLQNPYLFIYLCTVSLFFLIIRLHPFSYFTSCTPFYLFVYFYLILSSYLLNSEAVQEEALRQQNAL